MAQAAGSSHPARGAVYSGYDASLRRCCVLAPKPKYNTIWRYHLTTRKSIYLLHSPTRLDGTLSVLISPPGYLRRPKSAQQSTTSTNLTPTNSFQSPPHRHASINDHLPACRVSCPKTKPKRVPSIYQLLPFSNAAAMPAGEQAAAGITAKPTATVNTHCPTITQTGTRCHTCPAPDCIVLSTISNPCDCASPVPTVTVNQPCKSGCSGACGTEYVFDTSTSTCPTATPPSASCEATVTVHSYPSDGCAYTCTSGFCIIDSKI